jgi:hypothetical protein
MPVIEVYVANLTMHSGVNRQRLILVDRTIGPIIERPLDGMLTRNRCPTGPAVQQAWIAGKPCDPLQLAQLRLQPMMTFPGDLFLHVRSQHVLTPMVDYTVHRTVMHLLFHDFG